MHERAKIGIVLLSVVFMAHARPGMAQDERFQKIEQRLNAMEERVANATSKSDSILAYTPAALAVLGLGLYCGLWARSSGRDFWLWFVAGLVFNVFTLIAVLDAHEKDKKAKRDSAKSASRESFDML